MKLPSKWQTFEPQFDYEKSFNDYIEAWAGHIFWGYDMVRNFEPELIVELGTYKGTSLYSFSQAVKDANLKTKVYGVDSWRGDEQTGFYGEELYEHVKNILVSYYSKQDVNQLKMLFDEALPKFEDNSIDILHIDGLHTYEAVKYDYDTWAPKVKDDGIIIFHDTRVEEFGVKDFFAELQKAHPEYLYLNFEHNFGLGVMFKDPKTKDLFSEEDFDWFIKYYKARGCRSVAEKKVQALEAELKATTDDKLALITEVERVSGMANSYREYAENLQSIMQRRSIKLALKGSDILRKLKRK